MMTNAFARSAVLGIAVPFGSATAGAQTTQTVTNAGSTWALIVDADHTADIAVSLLQREAMRISVILRATTRRLERRQEALRIMARRRLALHMPRAHGGNE